jgi:hypothetical protein
MDTDWPSFLEPPPKDQRSLGSKIAIGIAGSIGVWLVVDELTSIFNGYIVAAVAAVIIGAVFLKTDNSKRSQQFWVLAILGACAIGWMLLVFIFSFFNVWIFFGLTAALAGVVLWKELRQRQRQHWLDTGCCGGCGYDLRATPERCPECGRDTSLDEPTWRKLRREWGHIKPADELEPLAVEPVPQPRPIAKIPTILRTPDFDEGPIPLEGDEGNSKYETSKPPNK